MHYSPCYRSEITSPLILRYELANTSVQCTMSTYTSRYNILFLQLVCLTYDLFCSCSLIILYIPKTDNFTDNSLLVIYIVFFYKRRVKRRRVYNWVQFNSYGNSVTHVSYEYLDFIHLAARLWYFYTVDIFYYKKDPKYLKHILVNVLLKQYIYYSLQF